MDRFLDGRSYDVIIIGAGIIGLTTAYELLKRGRKVAIVDAADPMQGCSAGNAGYLAEANIFPPASRVTKQFHEAIRCTTRADNNLIPG